MLCLLSYQDNMLTGHNRLMLFIVPFCSKSPIWEFRYRSAYFIQKDEIVLIRWGINRRPPLCKSKRSFVSMIMYSGRRVGSHHIYMWGVGQKLPYSAGRRPRSEVGALPPFGFPTQDIIEKLRLWFVNLRTPNSSHSPCQGQKMTSLWVTLAMGSTWITPTRPASRWSRR